MITGRRWLLVAAVLLLGAAVASAAPAQAAKPTVQGWWRSSINVLGVDLTALLDPSTVDVPADGLLVAGGTSATQPQAIAAVAYTVDGSVAGPLRLVPHAATATVPGSGAMACPLDNPTFKPAQGGLIADAPKYDCLGAVTAKVDADGAYVFDVSTLVRGDAVAVAILPTSQTSRIVFASPGDDSLPVKAETAAPSAPAPADTAAAGSVLDPLASLRPSGSVLGAATTAPSAPAAAPAPAASASTPAAVAPIGASATTPGNGSAGRAFFLLAIAAAAGVAWVVAGRPRRRSASVS